ncbi:hypothetical protein GOE20_11505 [Sinorhizobium medicae]|nr:hypothetical protein [Sinorhizobium medicae]
MRSEAASSDAQPGLERRKTIHGVAPNLLYRWRRLLSERGAAAADGV